MTNAPRSPRSDLDMSLSPSETGLERLIAELCFRDQRVVLLTVGMLAPPRGPVDPMVYTHDSSRMGVPGSAYMLGRLPPGERTPFSYLPDVAPFMTFGSPWPSVGETIRGGVATYLRSVQERRAMGRAEGAVLASLGIPVEFASPVVEAERWQEFRGIFDEVAPPIAEAERGLSENEDPGPLLAALLGPPAAMRMIGIEVDPNTSYTPWAARLYQQEPLHGMGPARFRGLGDRQRTFHGKGKRLAPVLRSLLDDLAWWLKDQDVLTIGAAKSEVAYRALADGRPPASGGRTSHN